MGKRSRSSTLGSSSRQISSYFYFYFFFFFFSSENWSLIYLNNNKVAFISDIVRAIRNTARRGSRDPSIANEHRSIFTFISFPSVHATRSYHSPVTSIRYQSLKREYLICFRVERGTVPLSCSMQKQSESFDQCFSSSSTGEKKRRGRGNDRIDEREETNSLFFLSLSLSVSFSHSLFVVD